jgi:p-hydroxybenzoate 3-monooxygenase
MLISLRLHSSISADTLLARSHDLGRARETKGPDVPELSTSVCVIGGGPSGLLLAHLLRQRGIDCVVLERRSRVHLEARVRAGLLEHGTVELLRRAGTAGRLDRQALRHEGMWIHAGEERFRFPFAELSGEPVWIYGQQELVKDLIALHLTSGTRLNFSVDDVRIVELGRDQCQVSGRVDGQDVVITSDFIAGCDGFHGVSRSAIPPSVARVHQHTYPFSWLGILAAAPPYSRELVYAAHDRGFALQSMRSPQVSRLYLQVPADEDVATRTDEQIWTELDTRLLGTRDNLHRGPVLERTLVAMRAVMVEPLSYRRLFLVGDAGHIVPPSAAKGLNLAVADAHLLAGALTDWYTRGRAELLDAYAPTALRRAWLGQEFSATMTRLMHPFPGDSTFDRALRHTHLTQLTSRNPIAQAFAHRYAGLDRQ